MLLIILPTLVTTDWGKENNETFQGLMDTDADSRNPKQQPSNQSRILRRTGYQWSFSSGPFIVGPVGPQTHSVGSPVPGYIIVTHLLTRWQNFHTVSSLTCGVGVIIWGKAEWKLLKLILPRKTQ